MTRSWLERNLAERKAVKYFEHYLLEDYRQQHARTSSERWWLGRAARVAWQRALYWWEVAGNVR